MNIQIKNIHWTRPSLRGTNCNLFIWTFPADTVFTNRGSEMLSCVKLQVPSSLHFHIFLNRNQLRDSGQGGRESVYRCIFRLPPKPEFFQSYSIFHSVEISVDQEHQGTCASSKHRTTRFFQTSNPSVIVEEILVSFS